MTLNELKEALAEILSVEEVPATDWDLVEALSERTYVRLTEPDTPQNFPLEAVLGYLAGFLRRKSDGRFGCQQRQWLRRYLSEGNPL